jgi:hypothetical protein
MNNLEMHWLALHRLENLRRDAMETNQSRLLLKGWRSRLATTLRRIAERLEPDLGRINPRRNLRA